MEIARHPGQLCVLSLAFVFNYSVSSCQGAWLHPLFCSVEVAFCSELSQKYLGLQLGEVLCVGSPHPSRPCIRRMYNIRSNTLIYLWSLILLCGDVESNPGPTNGSDVDVDVHSKFVSAALFSIVVLFKLLFMIYQVSQKVTITI